MQQNLQKCRLTQGREVFRILRLGQFKDRIKQFRDAAGLEQKALAERIRVDKMTVWRWEKGDSLPNYAQLEALADALGVTLDQLFGRDPRPPTPEPSPKAQLIDTVLALDDEKSELILRLIRSRLDPNALDRLREIVRNHEVLNKRLKDGNNQR